MLDLENGSLKNREIKNEKNVINWIRFEIFIYYSDGFHNVRYNWMVKWMLKRSLCLE